MTSQQNLVCDSSNITNFKQWAQAISTFFGTAGWAQTADTGQVNWSTIASPPGSGASVFEMWTPNDGLTAFVVLIQYGNFASHTNSPQISITIGLGSDGSGNLTGSKTSTFATNSAFITAPSASTQYECDFSGDLGRIGAMMWRNSPAVGFTQQLFVIERSLNAAGAYTDEYVTMVIGGAPFLLNTGNQSFRQQTLMLNSNLSQAQPSADNGHDGNMQLAVRFGLNAAATGFVGKKAFDTVAPQLGYFGFQMTTIGGGLGADFTEGATFTVQVYGSTRTYVGSKNGSFAGFGPMFGFTIGAVAMRYD